MSIRLRLTLLYSAILALTLVLSGAALYGIVARVVQGAAADALRAEASGFAAALHVGRDGVVVVPPDIVVAPHIYIQLRTLTGAVVSQSPGLPAARGILPLSVAEMQSAVQGGVVAPRTVMAGDEQVLVAAAPVTSFNHVIAILQMARSMADIDQPLAVLRPLMLAGGVLATVLACLVGWLLAGAALRPINRITQTARSIGDAQDFDRRVIYPGPMDEVGRLATTFNTMLARLGEAYQAQRRFVADASHELRTPLTSIRGNLGLLQREPPIDAHDRRAVLDDLVSESERLSRLLADLLTLARTDSGRLRRREPVALNPLLDDLLRRVVMSYPGRHVRVEGHAGVTVLGDPDAVTQTMLILIDNALKFTSHTDDVCVEVSNANTQVTISVRDTGPGIPSESVPHIFERFYQGDTARTGVGTGLGLAIARALVDAQGGTITVESQPGHGSAFTVTMPRASQPVTATSALK